MSSNDPGELTISWSTANLQPDSYRIRWARQDLNFPSYSSDNEAHRGNEYTGGTATAITLTELTPGATYKMQIRARWLDGGLNDGPWSGPWSDTHTAVIIGGPPGTVDGLTLTADQTPSVSLTWTARPSGEAVTGYKIHRGDSADSLSELVADTGNVETSYTDSTVSHNSTYHYQVSAINANGTGDGSTIESVTVPPEPVSSPTALTATVGTELRVSLSWTAPTDQTVTGYRIHRGTSANSLAVLVDDTGSTATTYEDTNLKGTTTYYYTVSALNGVNASPATAAASVTTPTAPLPVPGNVTATANDHASVTISWTIEDDDRVTGFKITRQQDSDESIILVSDTGNTDLSYTDNTILTRATYTYSVAALTETDESVRSSAATIRTPIPAETPRTLFSNKTDSDLTTQHTGPIIHWFHTGRSPSGYNLTSATVYVSVHPSRSAASLSVEIHEHVPAEGEREATLRLITRSKLTTADANGHVTFQAPNVILQPNRYYRLRFAPGLIAPLLKYRTDNGLTEGNDTGWSLAGSPSGAFTTTIDSDHPNARVMFKFTGHPDHSRNEPPDGDLHEHRDTNGIIHINRASRGYIPPFNGDQDQDWYAVQLDSGETYTFFVLGDGGTDCTALATLALDLYGPDGQAIAASQRTRDGTNVDRFTYTATQTGEHYFDVSTDFTTGDYGIGQYLASVIRGNDNSLLTRIGEAGCRPEAPTGLTVSRSGSTATVTWDAPSHSAITGYQITRTDDRGATVTRKTTDTSTTYTDRAAVPARTYTYQVAALSDAGRSAYTGKVTTAPTTSSKSKTKGPSSPATTQRQNPNTPGTPGTITHFSFNTAIELAWTAPSGPTVTGYRIRYRPTSGSWKTAVNNTNSQDTMYTVRGLTRNTEYTIEIRARNNNLPPNDQLGPERTKVIRTANTESTGTPLTRDQISIGTVTSRMLVGAGGSHGPTVYAGSETSYSGSSQGLAVSFTTGGNKHKYGLENIKITAQKTIDVAVDPVVKLHADHNGAPGDAIVTLTDPPDLATTLKHTNMAALTFAAPASTILEPSTTYWLTFDVDTSRLEISATRTDDEHRQSFPDWTLGDNTYGRPDRSINTWTRHSQHTIKIEINGVNLRYHNRENQKWEFAASTDTLGAIKPGGTATGELTEAHDAGNHGTKGDWFRMDVRPWRTYRLVADFGAADMARGGGVEIHGLGAWDHHRNDGRVIVEFYTPRNYTEYFVRVQASDYAENAVSPRDPVQSATYYGDYTLKLTDITEYNKMAGAWGYPETQEIGTVHVGHVGENNYKIAASFTTGTNAAGYTFGWIDAYLKSTHNSRTTANPYGPPSSPTFEIARDSSGEPGTKIFDLNGPKQVTPMPRYYTPTQLFAESAQTLAASTTYWLVTSVSEENAAFVANAFTSAYNDTDGDGTWALPSTIMRIDLANRNSNWTRFTDRFNLIFDLFAKAK